MTDILKIWRAGRVMRWHVNPHLCGTTDPDDGHAARVTLMALSMCPDMSRNGIIRGLTHDLGEHAAGDMSHMVKVQNPKLAAEIASMEHMAILGLGFDQPKLNDFEGNLIKLCDWLDAWLWMAHNAPHLRNRADWRAQKKSAHNLAGSLGLLDHITQVERDIEAEHSS